MRYMNASAITLTLQKGDDPVTDQSSALPHRVSAFDLVASQPWAILPAMLETIGAIARRENESVDALEARLGRPLQNARNVMVRDGVAIIPVTGPVMRYGNLFSQISGATSLDVLARDFTAAHDDPAIKAIVLDLNTPGGQANGISDFAALVRASTKPVTAFVEQAASAGYWIASAARDIAISKTGEVGSVGAVVEMSTGGSAGKVEIVSSQSPNKRPDVTTDAGRAQIQARVDKWAQAFIDDVAANRNTTAEDVLARFGQGDMKMGQEAVASGMADRVATLEEVIAGLSGKSAKGAIMANEAGAADAQTPHINREYLAAHHPDLITALQGEGATAERSRILDVQAQCSAIPGHAALMATLMADGVTTGPMAAVAVLAAEQSLAAGRRTALAADRLDPVAHAAAPSAAEDAAQGAPAADADANLPVEARCEKQWNASAELHKEFPSLGAYTAYIKNSEAGRARVFGSK